MTKLAIRLFKDKIGAFFVSASSKEAKKKKISAGHQQIS